MKGSITFTHLFYSLIFLLLSCSCNKISSEEKDYQKEIIGLWQLTEMYDNGKSMELPYGNDVYFSFDTNGIAKEIYQPYDELKEYLVYLEIYMKYKVEGNMIYCEKPFKATDDYYLQFTYGPYNIISLENGQLIVESGTLRIIYKKVRKHIQ